VPGHVRIAELPDRRSQHLPCEMARGDYLLLWHQRPTPDQGTACNRAPVSTMTLIPVSSPSSTVTAWTTGLWPRVGVSALSQRAPHQSTRRRGSVHQAEPDDHRPAVCRRYSSRLGASPCRKVHRRYRSDSRVRTPSHRGGVRWASSALRAESTTSAGYTRSARPMPRPLAHPHGRDTQRRSIT
jgi:hypothetical protein